MNQASTRMTIISNIKFAVDDYVFKSHFIIVVKRRALRTAYTWDFLLPSFVSCVGTETVMMSLFALDLKHKQIYQ